MKITMLGTGAALLDPDRGHTAIAVEIGDRAYLLDCGTGATRKMIEANIDPTSVEAVFLTHLHFDHTADLPVFVIGGWMANRQSSPIIVGPEGTDDMISHMFEGGAFAKDIEARAAYVQRQSNLAAIRPDIRPMSPGVVYEDDRIKVTANTVDHIPEEISKCYGLRIESDDAVIAFSGDTTPQLNMIELARDVDLLIHEATFPEEAIAFRAKNGIGTFSHTSPRQLGTLATQAGAKSVIATHIGHWDSTNPIVRKLAEKHLPVEIMGPSLIDTVIGDIKANYRGPVRIAHDLMTIHI